ncbi:MAG: glycosyltransferase family 2 protein [Anaerolineae bacterium]|nr:glycosyltransferase family 2 protein [Anaerolineae bacterium]
MSDAPYLSIVLPAHNEADRLPRALAQIDAYMQDKPYSFEVVIVENGSSDGTAAIAQQFGDTHPYVRVFIESARGKGLALRRGMLEARGQYRFFADVDFSMPISELDRFLPDGIAGYDIAIGSREAQGAVRYNEPWHRHFMGRVNNWIIKLAALPDFEDTQCGFKMFTAAAAEDLFGVSRMGGIGFDVEVLFVAVKRGYRINEIGIDWYFDTDSRMRLVGDSLHMIEEIMEIRRNWREGLYARPQPESGVPV